MLLNACPIVSADRQQAVIAQDHDLTVAEILGQALALVEIDGHALEIMIRHPRPAHRRLRQRQQPAFEGGHRHARIGVSVQHAGDVGTRGVDRAVDHVARQVDRVFGIRIGDDAPLEIDLDQRRGGDLLVHHPERVDEKMLLFARHARRDVVEMEIAHPVEIDQAIAGGEIDPRLPLQRIDVRRARGLHRGRLDPGNRVHRPTPSIDAYTSLPAILASAIALVTATLPPRCRWRRGHPSR